MIKKPDYIKKTCELCKEIKLIKYGCKSCDPCRVKHRKEYKKNYYKEIYYPKNREKEIARVIKHNQELQKIEKKLGLSNDKRKR